jgi:hypothetical protein
MPPSAPATAAPIQAPSAPAGSTPPYGGTPGASAPGGSFGGGGTEHVCVECYMPFRPCMLFCHVDVLPRIQVPLHRGRIPRRRGRVCSTLQNLLPAGPTAVPPQASAYCACGRRRQEQGPPRRGGRCRREPGQPQRCIRARDESPLTQESPCMLLRHVHVSRIHVPRIPCYDCRVIPPSPSFGGLAKGFCPRRRGTSCRHTAAGAIFGSNGHGGHQHCCLGCLPYSCGQGPDLMPR